VAFGFPSSNSANGDSMGSEQLRRDLSDNTGQLQNHQFGCSAYLQHIPLNKSDHSASKKPKNAEQTLRL
jgi:hypothetical protein